MTREESFRIEGSLTARTRRGNRLAVGVIDQVAAGKDACEVGPRGTAIHHYVTLVIQGDLPLEKLTSRQVSNSYEQPGHIFLRSFACDGISQR